MLVWIIRSIARLPLGWLQAVGALAGRAALAASPSFRRKTAANLELAGLASPQMLVGTAREIGRGVLESPWIWFREPAEVERAAANPDTEAIQAARAAGRGVILLTPHLGSFEVCARAYAALGPITVLYKPPKIEALHRVLARARSGPNLSAVPTTGTGVRALLRALKRGEMIGVLPDQVPSDGDGAWAPFFGRPAYTMTLPQRLAQATGAAVFMVAGERLPEARGWRVHVEALDDASPAAVNRAMEALIRRFPAQYFWGYNRYKVPERARGKPQHQQQGAP